MFQLKHLHLYIVIVITVIIALSSMTLSYHSEAECKKNTCNQQQNIVISNVDDMKICTFNLTALVNILRHFYNSIDLLVSSAL